MGIYINDKKLDLTGRTFGRLTVIEVDTSITKLKSRQRRWLCNCECGETTTVAGSALKNNQTRSCGCLRKEASAAMGRASRTWSLKHGESKSPEYRSWNAMVNRCLRKGNPAYKFYGALGVLVCSRWLTFEKFLTDMGRRPNLAYSLDRINPRGDYTKENCRWATREQQANNKRNTILVSYKGETYPLRPLARSLGIAPDMVDDRINAGWPVEEALTRPAKVWKLYITYKGEAKSIIEWSKVTGIHNNTIRERLKRGLSPEECLNNWKPS